MGNPLECVSYRRGVLGKRNEGRKMAHIQRQRSGGCIGQNVMFEHFGI